MSCFFSEKGGKKKLGRRRFSKITIISETSRSPGSNAFFFYQRI